MVDHTDETDSTQGDLAQRYKLTLAYDGSGFYGWQKQHPPDKPPMRTVQQVVEDSLVRLVRQPVTVTGASRTDSGVHAEGQVCHFDAQTPIPTDRMLLALNQKLPADVEARQLVAVRPPFHAIGDVQTKQYQYRLWTASSKPLGLRHLVYHCWTPLDIDRMNDAASRLVGRHDFAGFSAAGHGRASTVRTIHRCDVNRDTLDAGKAQTTTITVEGEGFLYNMVRIIAGTLVEVGRNKFEPARVDLALRDADRRQAGPTLPPMGLVLVWIRYGDG